MAKSSIRDKYSTVIECNGLDKKYQILHMLNSKEIMVQIVDNDTGATIHDSEYSCTRDNMNSMIIKFNAPPIARKKFIILTLRLN